MEIDELAQLPCGVDWCKNPILVEAGSMPRERLVAVCDHLQVIHKLDAKDAWALGAYLQPEGAFQVYQSLGGG